MLGEVYALLAALNWSLALVLLKRSGESMHPLSLSLFKNVVAIVLLAITLPFLHDPTGLLGDMHLHDIFILVLSGVIGIALADSLLLYSLKTIGVGLLTIMECTYTPSVVLVAWLYLGESIETYHYVGGGLILVGLLVSSTHKPPVDRTRKQLIIGMVLGAVSIMLMAFGIVIAKPILEQTPLIPAATIRLVGGSVILAMFMAASPDRAKLFAVFRPARVWRISVPASVLGTYFAMIFWVGGFKYAQAGVAAVLNQTSTVMALIFATWILKEPFTRRKFASACLALAGVVVVTLGGNLEIVFGAASD